MPKSKQLFFTITYIVVLALVTEVLLRLGLLHYGYRFFQPSDYIYDGFYPELKEVADKEIRSDDDVEDVLILGGSVVNSSWSGLERRLDSILTRQYPGHKKFSFYNLAEPGHTSLDNWLKYSLLNKQRFDLVIFYEAINETRTNNIPTSDFRGDYSHIKWYVDIYLLLTSQEIDFSVIPYLTKKAFRAIHDCWNGKVYITHHKVEPSFVRFGSDIKSARSYKSNLIKIIDTAARRGDKLLLMSYKSYLPKKVRLTGKGADNQYYAKCKYATAVTLWGDPANVQKGITRHNIVLKRLADNNSVYYLDMASKMPHDAALFCDICHLSEPGAQRFASELAGYLIEERIFD
jgi:hypothetical protein